MNQPLPSIELYWHMYVRLFQKFVQNNEAFRCRYFVSLKVLRQLLLELCADEHDTRTQEAIEVLHAAVKNMYYRIK